jgi:hypothetical protein
MLDSCFMIKDNICIKLISVNLAFRTTKISSVHITQLLRENDKENIWQRSDQQLQQHIVSDNFSPQETAP